MSWYYKNNIISELPEDCAGFVYIIYNLTNNRKYIGQKLFYFSKTTYKTVTLKNGKKKRKRIKGKIESDWQDYWSSSDELKADVELLGKNNFKREILHFCKTKSECNYLEAKEQFLREVLESQEYYNGHIRVRVHKNHVTKLVENKKI